MLYCFKTDLWMVNQFWKNEATAQSFYEKGWLLFISGYYWCGEGRDRKAAEPQGCCACGFPAFKALAYITLKHSTVAMCMDN